MVELFNNRSNDFSFLRQVCNLQNEGQKTYAGLTSESIHTGAISIKQRHDLGEVLESDSFFEAPES